MNDVAVFHPGLQHAHQLAWGLHERGMLQAFWSGVPVRSPDAQPPWLVPSQIRERMRSTAIPSALRRHPVQWQLLIRAGALCRSPASRHDYTHRMFHWFDRWVADHVRKLKPRAVVGFENSAFHTFNAARSIGAKCILDAPSLHHREARQLMDISSNGYMAEINRRKDEEVRMADMVITCSGMARESYVSNGVSPEKVHSILLGGELPHSVRREAETQHPARFIFAGTLSVRKSIDLILEAFARLNADGHRADLTLVGGAEEPRWIEAARNTPHVHYRPAVAQEQLYALLAQSDCLLLPSRFDAFGMVVVEAMATGTPAIVSSRTGAKEVLSLFPESGWVVEPTTQSIYECMEQRVRDRASLRSASLASLDAAQYFSWRAYRARIASLIVDVLG
jgi:glycosyltransferase involved in cell wall biosynthesis